MRWRAPTLSVLLILATGCTTEVVDFTLKKASANDGAVPTCEMVEGAKFTRCRYCTQPGSDASVKGDCYKLGCVPSTTWTECKECWWGDTPTEVCHICSKNDVVTKDTCTSNGSSIKKDAG
jgi:hypothetical protein